MILYHFANVIFCKSMAPTCTVTADHFKISNLEMERAMETLREQASSIFSSSFQMNESALYQMQAVGAKMKRNYLQMLADMFCRDKIYHYYRQEHENDYVHFKLDEAMASNKHLKSLGKS